MKKNNHIRLKELLSQDKSHEVIRVLLTVTNTNKSSLYDDLIVISSRLKDLENLQRKGMTAITEAHTEKAKITNSILSIINDLSEEDFEADIVWAVDTNNSVIITSRPDTVGEVASKKDVSSKKDIPITRTLFILSFLILIFLFFQLYRDYIKDDKKTEDLARIQPQKLMNTDTITEPSPVKNIQDNSTDIEEITSKIYLRFNADEYKEASILDTLYAEKLTDYYGDIDVPKIKCVNDQSSHYKNEPDSHSKLVSEIDFSTSDNIIYRCIFKKQLEDKSKKTIFRSVLVFKKFSFGFRIIGEFDMR